MSRIGEKKRKSINSMKALDRDRAAWQVRRGMKSLGVLFSCAWAAVAIRVDWPVKKSCETPGDIVIGGLMMVHEREDTVVCGPVMPQGGQ
ncbi:unnamed protein product [Nezara viridula]|uniref:Uncharacterized protein n=1 Tax=Nezara viridula TaxID=85310 RepID=A0A9P0HT03_NEZVI|nr:unnamed protein product [Nezara viridula]